MNAAEIIEEIVRLPQNEQGEVIHFVRHLTNLTNLPNLETLEAINEPTGGLPRYTNMTEVSSALKDLVRDA